jgi:hypothetical protein
MTAAFLLGNVLSVTAADPICLEAEWASELTAPMQLGGSAHGDPHPPWKAAGDASGDAYIEVPDGKGKPPDIDPGTAVWKFTVEREGKYILWCRVWWADECGNSLTMYLDDNRPFIFGQDSTYKTWHWVKALSSLKQLTLDAGEHTLTVKHREDGMRIDQILLTRHKRYIPVGVEDTTVAASGRE